MARDLPGGNQFRSSADFILFGDLQHHLQIRQSSTCRQRQHLSNLCREVVAKQNFAGHLGSRHGLSGNQEHAARAGEVLDQVHPRVSDGLASFRVLMRVEFRGFARKWAFRSAKYRSMAALASSTEA